MNALDERYMMVAVDLIGYGETPPWEAERPQRLTDQSASVALADAFYLPALR